MNANNIIVKLKIASIVPLFVCMFWVNRFYTQTNSQNVISWDAPAGEVASTDYSVTADQESIFVYSTYEFLKGSGTEIAGRSVSPVSFCSFDLVNGPIEIKVSIDNESLNRNTVSIVPQSLGLSANVVNNEFTFTINSPGKITILPGGEYLHPLHIFVNDKEVDIPDPDDSNVIYYGPGFHSVKLIDLQSDQTLYLAGGAILEAEPLTAAEINANPNFTENNVNGIPMHIGPFIEAKWKDNVKIRGRGIVRGRISLQNNQRRPLFRLTGISNLQMEGIIITECSAWNVNIHGCSNVNVDNIKILSYFNNSDGILVSGTNNAVVENSFIHNSDDGFETKGFGEPMNNILFNNNIAWTTVGASFGHTAETVHPVSNVNFTNNTVLYFQNQLGVRGPLSVHAKDSEAGAHQAKVSDYTFENIVIEKMVGKFNPPIKIMNNWDYWNYNHPTVSGNPYQLVSENPAYRPAPPIKDIVFKNIEVLSAANEHVVIMGDDVVSKIENITFEDVVINGVNLTTNDSRIWTNEYTSNITVLNNEIDDYCSVSGLNSLTSSYIESLSTTFANSNIDFIGGSYPTNGYQAYNSEIIEAQQGESFTLNMTNSQDTKWDRVKGWIDWNGDDIFDESTEKIFHLGEVNQDNSSLVLNISEPINVPSDATIGQTTMRIRFDGVWIPNDVVPCEFVDKTTTYDFQVIVANGESNILTPIENDPIPEEDNDSIKIYPNPSAGEFFISSNEPICSVSVFSMNGRKLKEIKNIDEPIFNADFLDLNQCMYLLLIKTWVGENEKMKTMKIIIK